jgi:hypothetical protein
VIAILTTTDRVKLSAAQALLAGENIQSELFDTAAGQLWTSIIPVRLMVEEADAALARGALRAAGFTEAADGDWDLK